MINPYPLAMVMCDAIWTDPATGKRILLGCFTTIFFGSFPAPRRAMAVYVVLTGGRSRVPVRIQLVDAAGTRPPILTGEADVVFHDPRTVVEMEFHFGGLEFPKPGGYLFQLFAWNEVLMERRIDVRHKTEGAE